jgi:hypothetical protein
VSRYQFIFRDAFGNSLHNTNRLFSFEMARREMEVGALSLEMPFVEPLISIVKRDLRIDVMRSTQGFPFYLEGDTTWLIRDFSRIENASGKFLKIKAEDAVSLLRRKVIAYKKTTAYADWTGLNDDNLKKLVRTNAGALATDALRQINAALFTVAIDMGLMSSNIIDGGYNNLLDEIIDNCNQALKPATGTGRYLTFDVVCVSTAQLEFRTFADQRGANRTVAPSILTFSIANKNLSSIAIEDDALDEFNVVYAAGVGENANRTLVTAVDTPLSTFSPFSRIEKFIDGQSASTTDALTQEAHKELVTGRPKRTVEAKIQENNNCRYGVHYGFGDLVNVTGFGETFQCHLDTLSIKYEKGRETITPILHGEKYI